MSFLKRVKAAFASAKIDWEDSYRGVKFEVWCDDSKGTYDVFLYLKAGKTLVAKDKDFGVFGPKNFVFDAIDKAIRDKKV